MNLRTTVEGAENGEDDAVVLNSKPVHKSLEPPVDPVVMNPNPTAKVKYGECMRNHAASIGGHASDGCGEFMPSSSAAGDSLTCAACGCHRNFHRKEIHGSGRHPQIVKYSPPPGMVLYNSGTTTKIRGFTAVVPYSHDLFGDDEDRNCDRRSETPELDDAGAAAYPAAAAAKSKRFRTRFTKEQKERMVEFAERSGWRILKQNDVAMNQFCSEVGVKRNVLKVWMHNNKSSHQRRSETSAAASPPPPPPNSHPLAPPQAIGV